MADVTRRDSLWLGAAALGATALPSIGARAQSVTSEVPTADVKAPDFTPEKGAHLHVIRPAKFIDPDQTYWDINSKKYTEKTGVPVKVDYVSWEDLRPQLAVIANTGAGADVFIGFSSDPFIYDSKLIGLTDLCEYLGAKYGGWFDLAKLYGTRWKTNDWIGLPIGGSTGPTVYRKSWVTQAGYDKIPNDLDGFLKLCQALKKIGHPCGFSLGHALGDANGFAEWAMWSHGAAVVDENGKVTLESPATIEALKYAAELYKTMIPGTMSWNDSGNNKAYEAGDISLTFNGVSIYYVAKTSTDPKLQAIAADTYHQLVPQGVAKRSPMSAAAMNAMVLKSTKYPNAAKDYLRFMMEAPQYGVWLEKCIGYWAQPLKAYAKMKFWTEDPKLQAYSAAMDTIYYDGYAGPITAASSAVVANYTVVDMFAAVAAGAMSPEDAAKQAQKQAERYYKTT